MFFRTLRKAKLPVLAVCAALTLVVASAALAGSGVGAPFNLGKKNTVNKLSSLVGKAAGPMLRVVNNGNGTALNLQVKAGKPPMTVNSNAKVNNLNADSLDGQDSSAFVPTNTNAFVRNNTYRAEDPVSFGTLLSDGTRVIAKSCNPGDRLLSGGPANINAGTILLESFPISTNTWQARIQNDATLDAFNVVVLCADQ